MHKRKLVFLLFFSSGMDVSFNERRKSRSYLQFGIFGGEIKFSFASFSQ